MPTDDADRCTLLEGLATFNRDLARLGPGPLVSDAAAALLTLEELAVTVTATKVHLLAVSRWLGGLAR